MIYKTKDSGKRQEFPSGSLRDTEEGKPRYDLISQHGLKRLAGLMTRGAEKYGERNWEKGQSKERFYSSAFRHLMQWAEGDKDEDHLAAVVFNVFGIIHMEEKMKEAEESKCCFKCSQLRLDTDNKRWNCTLTGFTNKSFSMESKDEIFTMTHSIGDCNDYEELCP